MSNPFTPEELAGLRAPFPFEAHSVREGQKNSGKTRIRWYVYIERSWVQDRLDELFPGEWATEKPEVTVLGNGERFGATVGITIRGVTRWDGGEDDGDEGFKGALTNGFRRAAAFGWGIGKYLYEIDIDIWTPSYEKGDWEGAKQRKAEAMSKFKAWYDRTFNAAAANGATPRENLYAQSVSKAEQSEVMITGFKAVKSKDGGIAYALSTQDGKTVWAHSRGVFRAYSGMDENAMRDWNVPGFKYQFTTPFSIPVVTRTGENGKPYLSAVVSQSEQGES